MNRLIQKYSFWIANKIKRSVVRGQSNARMLTLHLDRESFYACEKPKLPEGYSICSYQDKNYSQVCMLYMDANIGFCDVDYWKPNMLPRTHFVALEQRTGKVVGSIFGAQSLTDPNVGRLEFLAVNKKHRRKGLASVLTYSVTSNLAASKYQRLELDTFENMTGAISTYFKYGWRNEI